MRSSPHDLSEVQEDGDLVVTVCDLAHEELGHLLVVHWSVLGPVPTGDPGSFDAALAQLADRIERLAPPGGRLLTRWPARSPAGCCGCHLQEP